MEILCSYDVSSYLPLKKYSATTTSAFAYHLWIGLRHCISVLLTPLLKMYKLPSFDLHGPQTISRRPDFNYDIAPGCEHYLTPSCHAQHAGSSSSKQAQWKQMPNACKLLTVTMLVLNMSHTLFLVCCFSPVIGWAFIYMVFSFPYYIYQVWYVNLHFLCLLKFFFQLL